MKKIMLLFSMFFIITLGVKAQVVSTVFGSKANEASTEWVNKNASFKELLLEEEPNRGRIRSKAGAIGTATYTGVYSGTLSSKDVIYLKILRQSLKNTPIEKVIVKYKQNGGAIETTTLTLPTTTSIEEIVVIPGFTDGATLSELSFSFTKADGFPAFDILKPYKFVIGPNPR